MSKLGNIENSYGKQFSIAIANTYVDNILNADSLPANTIIISSPYDINTLEDLNTPAIIITDNEGEGVVLTKSLNTINGLKYENDKVSLFIDNSSIITNNKGELTIDLNKIINTINGLTLDNGIIKVNSNSLDKASKTKFGVVKVDDNTIKSDNGNIYIETQNLDLSTNTLPGIVKGDNNTILITNGVASIITNNLQRGGSNFGVVKPDNNSITINNGILSINLSYFINNNIGAIKCDGTTIVSNNGVLSVNNNGLQKASETTYGVIKYNNEQFEIKDEKLAVKNYDNMTYNLSNISSRIQAANEELTQIEEFISNI